MELRRRHDSTREPRAITRARRYSDRIARQSSRRRSPRDGWITGQRIRYLLEIHDIQAAVRVARECQSAEWWCAALEGLALQQGERRCTRQRVRSCVAHNASRGAMPVDRHDTRFSIRRCGSDTARSDAERMTTLQSVSGGSPIHSGRLPVTTGERSITPVTRWRRSSSHASIAYNLSWSSDLREMIVRYGWARYWTRGDGTVLRPEQRRRFLGMRQRLTITSFPCPGVWTLFTPSRSTWNGSIGRAICTADCESLHGARSAGRGVQARRLPSGRCGV